MKTVVLLFHPTNPPSRANKALAEAAREVADVEVRDMYALYQDGRIDVAAEQAVLEQADRIVLQFPLYWYATPPLLKQWEDDVLTYGWAYGGGTALQGKELAVAVTTGARGYGREGSIKYSVTDLLRPLQATSNLIGTRYVVPFVLEGVLGLTDSALAEATEKYKEYLEVKELATLGDYE